MPQHITAKSRRVSVPEARSDSDLEQPPRSEHVLGQSVPQGDGLGLLQAAHKELDQSAIRRERFNAVPRKHFNVGEVLRQQAPAPIVR